MVKQDFIQRSPMRILEKSINGGLKGGEIGVISSKKGVGKTAVLVQIALDKLLQGNRVVHVSFYQHADYVMQWYEDIFHELSRKKNLENASDVKSDLIMNRVIMNFNQDSLTTDQILKSLNALIVDGGFKAQALIIDGYDFAKSNCQTIEAFKSFAKKLNLEIWFSCTVNDNDSLSDKKTLPAVLKELQNEIDVIVSLDPKAEFIHFNVTKDRSELSPEGFDDLKLDPKTLLVAER